MGIKIVLSCLILSMTLTHIWCEDSNDNLIIHYYPTDKKVSQGELFIWLWGDIEADMPVKDKDSFGYRIVIDISQLRKKITDRPLNICWKFKLGQGAGADWSISTEGDRVWNETYGKEVWTVQGIGRWYRSSQEALSPQLIGGYIDAEREVLIELDRAVSRVNLDQCHLTDDKGKQVVLKKLKQRDKNLLLYLRESLDLMRGYHIKIDGITGESALIPRNIMKEFLPREKLALGVTYNPSKSIFRLFAPRASKVELLLYDSASKCEPKIHLLNLRDAGLWELELDGNWLDHFYTYRVSGPHLFPSPPEIIDPYSKCHHHPKTGSRIINDDTHVTKSPSFPFEQAIIYELHLRDFTIDPKGGISPEHKGKYLGLVQKDTYLDGNPSIKTGLEHLKELGVNVIQIMPVQDFDNDETKVGYNQEYNWGYMPAHFFTPEGWYASSPHDTSRVRELKQMVSTLHEAGFKVTLDVVFNHTAEMGEGGPLYNFKGIDPVYYYRIRSDGSYSNGSGCGNEFNTENPMARRFIIDCLSYFVNEYGFDGFRFDLLGLYDIDTIKAIKKALPDAFLYGEPWACGPSTIKVFQKGMQRGLGISVFNDNFRDAIKGTIWEATKGGYIQERIQVDKIKKGIMGSIEDFTEVPLESLNYVECHDNNTLYDKIVMTVTGSPNGIPTKEEEILIEKMVRMAGVLILTSQGIPFFEAGQEFMRSKKYEKDGKVFYHENSYNSPDSINQIDWSLKEKNYKTFCYYKGLIELRKAHPIFRKSVSKWIFKDLRFQDKWAPTPATLAYSLKSGKSRDSWSQVIVLLNPQRTPQTFKIPKGKWQVAVDAENAGTTSIRNVEGEMVTLEPVSAMILFTPQPG